MSRKSSFTMKYAPLQQQESSYTSAFTYGGENSSIKTEPRKWIFNKNHEDYQVSMPPSTYNSSLSIRALYMFGKILSFVFCLATLPFSLIFVLKLVHQYERIIVFRLGKLSNIKGPGLITVLPCIDKWKRIDLRTKAFNIPPTNLSTKDGGVISVGAVVYFRISDPVRMCLSVNDINQSIRHIAQSCMSSLLCKKTFDVVMTKRLNLSYDLQVDVNLAVSEWGAQVSSVELSDVTPIVKPTNIPSRLNICADSLIQSNPLLSSLASITEKVINHTNQETTNSNLKIEQFLKVIKSHLNEKLVNKVGVTYQFEIFNENMNETLLYFLDLKNDKGCLEKIEDNVDADVKVFLTANALYDIITKKADIYSSYSSGALKISGSINDATKLSHLFDIL